MNIGVITVWVLNNIYFVKILLICLNVKNEIKGIRLENHIVSSVFVCCVRLKRLQNFLWFAAIGLIVKFVFFKSFKIHRILIGVLRLILSALSTITTKIGFSRK